MKKRSLKPTEVLPAGTEIFHDDFKGLVLTGKMVPSSNNAGPICLHKVIYTHYFSEFTQEWVELPDEKKEIASINYSFIFIKA